MLDTTRVFTFGIGSGASVPLCQGIAKGSKENLFEFFSSTGNIFF